MKLRPIPCPVQGCSAYRTENNLAIICGREPCGPGGALRWHLSISHARRNPTWEEIREARYALVPDEVTVAMFLPPRAEYVNAHPFCFHLYEVEAADALVQIVRGL
jgi:hypothetical protein